MEPRNRQQQDYIEIKEFLPVGPTANPIGLNAVDVSTEDVSDERADVMSGEEAAGGRRPNPEKTLCGARGVRSSAPREFDSDAVGLGGLCVDTGR